VPKHPSAKDLDRFLLSTLPPARRDRVASHLRHCADCRAYVRPTLKVLLAPEDVDDQQEVETGDLYDAAVERACRKVLGWSGTLRRQRERAAPLIADLVQGKRTWGDLDDGEAESLRGIPKVDLLLEEARALRHDKPEKMVETAEMARRAAMRLDPRVYGSRIVADTRALALAELANAYRAANRPAVAEAAMLRALGYLEKGSGAPGLAARVLELAASLECDRRHFPEAYELIDRACHLHRQLGDDHMVGRALVKKSHFASCQGNAQAALVLVTEGFALLDLERDPNLGAAALQNAILYAVDAGHLKKALLHLWNAQRHGLLPGDEVNRIKLRATEGEIYAGLGKLERAETAFRAAKSDFERLGLTYVASITGLDLAAVWMRQGREEEVKALAEELAERFLRLNVGREALSAMLVLRQVCREDKVTEEGIRKVAAFLRELDRRPPGNLPPPTLADL
jgi:tetratricopeptide (TPR) repeat protein